MHTLHLGDCLEVLRTMSDCSIDAVVTDPPYGFGDGKRAGFMGKRWDYDVPSVEVWAECLRVLKPGGHLLAFAGTRTQHRMACRIEDAGFEIRDMIAWVYGCLDDQTQYASPDGPRPYHKAKVGDPVLCYNIETKEYSYQPIQDVYVYDYADTAYRLVGDHGVQVVSRNHRCLVERGGVEVFITAEEAAWEQQARVPVLEDLPALQQALRNARQSPSGQEQDLRKGMRGGDDRQSQQHPYADRAAQADEGAVCGVRCRDAQSRFVAEARRCSDLQQAVQWSTAGARVEEARQQGALTVEAGIRAGADRADDWAEQPSVEGRGHLSQPQGRLRQSADPLCPLPGAVAGDGSEGWLRDGASVAGGSGDRPATDQGGSGPSRQPRRDGQPAGEPDAVCHQRSAQGIRAWSGHRTSVVRIEPFHYTGKVWCLKVPTGCFVAVRDGMAFPTGNSGFPKSLDVSKAIDRAAGAEREVVGQYTVSRDMSGGSWADLHGIPNTAKQHDITTPATPEAQQWAGWGTALKPSIETVTWATKPFPPERERAKILGNLWKIEARLWLLSSASAVDQSSTSSQSEYGAACATAQWTADDATNTRAALRGLMDTWQCKMATHMSLSIVSSWRRTLEESSKPGSTSTTETESKTTTDWKTLSFCLSQITPEGIIQACSLPGGFSANASTAAQIFNASLALLQATHTLSAIEPATWQALDDSQGEAVRPTLNPVVMARKPLSGTVAANVLEHGTGALNVDGCRVAHDEDCRMMAPSQANIDNPSEKHRQAGRRESVLELKPGGRWPANLIHDGSDEVVGLFPQTTSTAGMKGTREGAIYGGGKGLGGENTLRGHSDTGSAARFFYTAKASASERQGTSHPTIKPIALMAYLCRLVTPPGGTVLDPFMGSGTTIKAANSEGFYAIGIEQDPDSFAMAEHRTDGAQLGLSL